MTDFVLDTFTEGGGNVNLESHTGETGASWTKGAGFSGSLLVNATTDQVYSNNALGVVYYSSGAATTDGEYVEGVIDRSNSTGAIGFGLRGDSATQKHYAVLFIADRVRLYRFNSNASLDQLQDAAYTATGTATVRIQATGVGASVSIDVTIGGSNPFGGAYSDSSASRLTSPGKATIYGDTVASTTNGTRLTSLQGVNGVVSSATIAITTPVSRKIHQSAGTTGTISVTGTYTGTPTTIEARLVQHGTNTPLSGFDWSTKVASPAGGTYSFSFSSVPNGGWYNVQVRHSNDTAVNATSGRVGVGELIAFDGQSNAYLFFSSTAYAGDSSLTPNDLLAIAGLQPTAWDVPNAATMNGAIACGNDLIAALGVPVGLIDGTLNGGGLTVSSGQGRYMNGAVADAGYTASAAAIAAETTSIAANVWYQGNTDAAGAVSQSTYYTALGNMIALRRADVGNAALPYVIVTLGRDTNGVNDANWQAIRKAQIQKCGDANIYRVDAADLPLHTDGIHHSAAGFTELGKRIARAVLAAKGLVSTYRGPRIAQVRKVSATVFDVLLTHDMGSDFTPTTGITGFRVLDGASPVTVSSAVRISATRIRLTLASAPAALPTVQYLYGAAPAVTSVAKDNGTLTLPIEANDGVVALDAPTATISLVSPANAPRASLTGLKWAWFDQTTPDAFVAPTDQGTGEVTDGSGVLTVSLPNTLKTSGQAGWLIVTDSDGTTTQSPAHKAFSGPVTVD